MKQANTNVTKIIKPSKIGISGPYALSLHRDENQTPREKKLQDS